MSAFSYGQSQAGTTRGGSDAERGRHADAPGARGIAVKRVEVEIDGVVAQAGLNEAGAPRATA